MAKKTTKPVKKGATPVKKATAVAKKKPAAGPAKKAAKASKAIQAKKPVKKVAKPSKAAVKKAVVKKTATKKAVAKKPVKAIKPSVKKAAPVAKKPAPAPSRPQAKPIALKIAPPKKEVAKPIVPPALPKSPAIKLPEIITKQQEPVKQVTSVKSTPQASKDGARYSDKDLKEFEILIIEKLKQSRTDLEELRQSLSHTGDNSTDDTSPTFKIMEDGSDTMSREEIAQLASRQEKFITALENALLRIKNKTYGICRVTGKLIPKERLRLVPHATLSIEAKNMQA